MLVETTRVTSF